MGGISMIRSILDNDKYTFSVQKFILEHYPDATVKYEFINRNPAQKFTRDFAVELNQSIKTIAQHKLTKNEAEWFGEIPEFKGWYTQYLKNYIFDSNQVLFDVVDGNLKLSIEGNWAETVMWEIPLLAEISSLYCNFYKTNKEVADEIAQHRLSLQNKSKQLSGLEFVEFGTRRRRSAEFQQIALEELKDTKGFMGTSNMHWARTMGLNHFGSMSHQLIQGVAGIEGVQRANYHVMKKWIQTFKGRLLMALPDTFTTDVFLRNFDEELTNTYQGVRQDSGCPFDFARKMYAHYTKFGIPIESKKIMFSDGLNPDKCWNMHNGGGAFRQSYGIGTNLTNDVPDSPGLNMVIKMVNINGTDVCKLSDTPGKVTGNPKCVEVTKYLLGIK